MDSKKIDLWKCFFALLMVFLIVPSSTAFSSKRMKKPNMTQIVLSRQTVKVRPHSNKSDSSLVCSQNAWCATLDRDYDYVSGQYGFWYTDPEDGLVFFDVASVEAVSTGVTGQYAAYKWEDGKVFWIRVNPNDNPKQLQTLYNGPSEDYPDCSSYLIQFILYRQAGVDYSGWENEAALCAMELIVDGEYKVVDYSIFVYDDDDKLLETRKLAVGDSIQGLTFGALAEEPEYVLLYYYDDFSTVTGEPVFEYTALIPGTDFTCSNLPFDLSQQKFYFRLEAYDEDNEQVPTWSEAQEIGTLSEIMGRPSNNQGSDGGGAGCFLSLKEMGYSSKSIGIAGLLLALLVGAVLFSRNRRGDL